MAKPVSILKYSALIGSLALLAGCTNPTANDSPLGTTQSSSTNTAETLKLISPQPVTSTTPVSSTKPTQKGGMKTLADFEQIKATQATIKTTKGDITFTLYRNEAPISTANFLNLAKTGFYDGIVFHRVIPDFMAQVGDPLTKDPSQQARWGMGGPGYTIPDEVNTGLKHDSEGVVSMANAGPGTGGSQFFITYEATPWLDGKHAVFGKVTTGMDVLKNITVGDKIISISYQ